MGVVRGGPPLVCLALKHHGVNQLWDIGHDATSLLINLYRSEEESVGRLNRDKNRTGGWDVKVGEERAIR